MSDNEMPMFNSVSNAFTHYVGDPYPQDCGDRSIDIGTAWASRRIQAAEPYKYDSIYDQLSLKNPHVTLPAPAMPTQPTRRIVRVLIADKDSRVPIEDCLLYKGEEVFTDLTDQELFFDIPIKDLLVKHNEKRVKIADGISGSSSATTVQYLKPIKVRDLVMTVVTVASF